MSHSATWLAGFVLAGAHPASAEECNRVTDMKSSTIDYQRGVETHPGLKDRPVGSCIVGDCYKGDGIAYVAAGLYEGHFSAGLPTGHGVMRHGVRPLHSASFNTDIVLTGSFARGCMYGDVTATVPNTAMTWRGTYDEETGTWKGNWYIVVDVKGTPTEMELSSRSPVQLPTQADLDRVRGNVMQVTRPSVPPPALAPFDPHSADPLAIATAAFDYVNTGVPNSRPGDRYGSALTPDERALVAPVYVLLRNYYDDREWKVVSRAASGLSVLYERGWIVREDRTLARMLWHFQYYKGDKPKVPPIPADFVLPPSPPPPEPPLRAFAPTSTDPAEIANAAFEYVFDVVPASFAPGRSRFSPLSREEAALVRPVYELLRRSYDSTDPKVAGRAAVGLEILYERGWIVAKDDALAKALHRYSKELRDKPVVPPTK